MHVLNSLSELLRPAITIPTCCLIGMNSNYLPDAELQFAGSSLEARVLRISATLDCFLFFANYLARI